MCADTPEDLKYPVFLPETDFPMRAGLPQREPGWLARWEEIGIYDRLRDKAKAALGPRFDVRDFNDAVIRTGASPLAVLATAIDDYIARAKG